MKAPGDAGRWLAAALILAIVVAEVADAVRAGGANRWTSAIQANGAPGAASPAASNRPLGIPHDWSHSHLIFSRPASPEAARRLERDPRYRIQQAWRHRQAIAGSAEVYMQSLDAMAVQLAAARRSGTMSPTKGKKPPKPTPTPANQLHGDWTASLGSGATVGAGRYPAKYSFNINGTSDCTNDFVVFNTGLSGTGSQASIIGFNQLYLGSAGSGGCGTSGVPAVAWAYNTAGRITNSVVLSGDGSQLAFVHTPISGAASLVILKWKSGAGQGTGVTAPALPQTVTTDPSTYVTCRAATNPTKSCQLTLTFGNNNNDASSSPFYDYINDIAYVGDDGGILHKFTGVFFGTPAEVNTSPWPDGMDTGSMLNSPVQDAGTSPPVVFVTTSGGHLAYVNTSTGTVVRSGLVGHATPPDIADAPLVDSSVGKIYVFVASDGAGNSAVVEFSRGFTTGATGSGKATIGTVGVIPIYAGNFDNSYYNSANATGNLYVCGNSGGNPTLYQVPINAGTFAPMPTPTPIPPALASANVTCSPVTEIYNPNASGGPFDWIFVSAQGSGSLANCGGGGCVMNFIVTAWQPSLAYSLNQEILDTKLNIEKVTTGGTSGSSQPNWNTTTGGTTSDGGTLVWTNQGSMGLNANAASRGESGGTSGIIVDNVSASAGSSQVYFSTLTNSACAGTGTNVGCGVQASQSGLSQVTPTPTPTATATATATATPTPTRTPTPKPT